MARALREGDLPEIAEIAKKTTHVLFLKVDVDELKEVAEGWSVEAMPTFIFFKKGEVVDKVVGASKEELRCTIANHASIPLEEAMTSTSAQSRKIRLQEELAEWQVCPPAGFKHRVTDNLQRWMIEERGAPGTLYTNETYQLQVDFPEHYPM